MPPQDPQKVIRVVQDSTKNLLHSFRSQANALRGCSENIRLLIREGYDKGIAYRTALDLFGKNTTSFLAIDGTESQDQELDMMIFYAGAFGYIGHLHFTELGNGCTYDEPLPIEGSLDLSTAISIHEQDTASVAGELTEGGLEIDSERLPSALMQLSEYYMAVKTIYENANIQIVILDRTLAGDLAHLIWSVAKAMEEDGSCILQGKDTRYGKVTGLDLELTRMLHANEDLKIPAARSHLIKYAVINKLLQNQKQELGEDNTLISKSQSITDNRISYKALLTTIGADRNRLDKLQKDMSKLNKRYSLLDDSDPENIGKTRWITVNDIDYLVLVMIYALLHAAWEKNILIIGIIKDISSAELMNTVIPILQSTGMISLNRKFPSLNSDKLFLQTASIVNSESMVAPWRTFEFDACFRTVVPPIYIP
jgi:NurA domain-containing protein